MKTGTIPSPRQLKLDRFNRPDFRSTAKRGKRGQGWTWSRAMYRLRRWAQRIHAEFDSQLQRDIIDPFAALVRKLTELKTQRLTRRPDLTARRARTALREQTSKEWATVRQVTRACMDEPHPARGIVETGAARQSVPSRLSARRPGAHRLADLATLPSKTYMLALDARQQYVIANLLRLKGLASSRAFGETTWKEARRADHYATA